MRVVIIGGTRGIGLGLAIRYLENGCEVVVCGRHPERLDDDPVAMHPRLVRLALDVRDRVKVGKVIDELAAGGIDLVVVSAGYYADAAAIKADPREAERIVDTNVRGLCHVFDAVIPVMREQQRGRLVAVASIAGLLAPYRNASLYSASKRAAISLCAVYRKVVAADGIGITTIVPGYVDTPRLREINNGSVRGKPFVMSQAEAVELIAAAIERGDEQFVFPRALHWLVLLFNVLPESLRSFRKK